jgi:hypothetical protein
MRHRNRGVCNDFCNFFVAKHPWKLSLLRKLSFVWKFRLNAAAKWVLTKDVAIMPRARRNRRELAPE